MMHNRRKPKPLNTRRLSYAFMLAAGFLCVFFFGGTVTYTLFFLCLLLPALSILHLFAARRHMSYRLRLDADAVQKSQLILYQVRLRNLNRIFTLPALRTEIPSLDDKEPPVIRSALSLLPGKGMNFGVSLSFPYRGIYTLPLPLVQTGDLLGLCWLQPPRPPQALTVKVYPQIHLLDSHGRLFSDRRPSPCQPSDGGQAETTATSDSRVYQYGDPLNRIHWKLTAQKNEMITRQFESEESSELLIFLDTAPLPAGATSAIEAADRLVECVLAVLYDCLKNDCPVRLVHGNPDGSIDEKIQCDQMSFDILLDHLTVLPFDGAPPLPNLVRHALRAHRPEAGAVVFTARLDEEIRAVMAALHSPDGPAAVVYISPDQTPPVFDAPPSVDVRIVPPGADIKTAMATRYTRRPLEEGGGS